MSPEEIPQELMKELSDSEKRLKGLLDKRDHFNEEAKVIREMRDDLHKKRKGILEQIQDIRAKRGQILEELKSAKSRRDAYNQRVRDLLGIKRRTDQDMKERDPFEDISTLEIELRKLEETYQTKAHSLEKEREIVKSIEEKRKKLEKLQAKEVTFKAERVQAQTKEDEITEYRRLADQEHSNVKELFNKLQEINEKLDEYSPTLDHLRKEGDKRHEEFLKTREHADSYHQKAMDLREKVLQLRQERDKLKKDARELIEDQNKKVRDELEDEGKLDEAADKAVDLLLKKGKISL
ncbi:MAG: hypothetical protein ACMUIE_00095 [Thermoplasmatota archaeon]